MVNEALARVVAKVALPTNIKVFATHQIISEQTSENFRSDLKSKKSLTPKQKHNFLKISDLRDFGYLKFLKDLNPVRNQLP